MKIRNFIENKKYADHFLIILSIFFAYGLLIPFLHYYIDDWYWIWSWDVFGYEGIAQYFSSNRPILRLIYDLTFPILSIHPLIAHIFALVNRILTTLIFFSLMTKIWPENRKVNLFTSIIFALYPGFCLQSIAVTYGHIFLFLSFFLLSLLLTIEWLNTKKYWLLFLSIILSFINIITLEYFFTLELIRFVIIWIILSRRNEKFISNLKQSLIHYIPYMVILAIAVVLRLTLFTEMQTNRYGMSFFSNLKSNPVATILQLISQVIYDFYLTTIAAWRPALEKIAGIQNFNRTVFFCIVICTMFCILLIFHLVRLTENKDKKTNNGSYFEMALLGISGILFAGWPIWLTVLKVSQYHLLSRFTLPFLFGASVFIGYIYYLLSKQKFLSSIFVFITIFSAMFYQIQIMNDFRIETTQNREMMWQIKWRIPDLEKNTLVLTTDYPNEYYDIATLATELSTLYPKEPEKFKLPFFMLYGRNINENNESGLQKNIPIKMNNITAVFKGTTSQMIAIDYDPGKCVRILDPDLDGIDTNLHEHVQRAAQLSDLSLIDLNFQSDGTEMYYFSKEPIDTWCYYFEKADLAKQQQNWEEVAALFDQAATQGFGFKSERERYPFIEAYAQLGQWDQAYALIKDSDQNELSIGICRLAKRIDETTPDSNEKSQFLTDVTNLMNCH